MSQQPIRALRDDAVLEPYIEENGPLTLEPAEDMFERLVVSLIRQQVSMDAASAIRGRLFEQFEITPEAMLAAEQNVLEDCGLSAAKATYVKHVAEAYETHGYDHSYFEGMSNEAVLEELTEIRGVGPWTAKMFLLFALARPDVFPVEDLGIRRGMEIVCDRELTRSEMCARAERWVPYRSYASLYLWRAYEG